MQRQLAFVLGEQTVLPATVWETLPEMARAKVTIMLARVLAAVIEEGRDE